MIQHRYQATRRGYTTAGSSWMDGRSFGVMCWRSGANRSTMVLHTGNFACIANRVALAAFYAMVAELIDLYPRPRHGSAMVLAVAEKTSLQPRPRQHPTLPAPPQNLPNQCEHEDKRAGALYLFVAFDTGKVYGQCYDRKRQQECIAFLEQVDREIEEHVTSLHLVCDQVSSHHGQEGRKWLSTHPRFVFHVTPVPCSWMNQVEPWFSILPRKRFRIVDFESKDHLRAKIGQFIEEWQQSAHPFTWSTHSVAKAMAEAPALAA